MALPARRSVLPLLAATCAASLLTGCGVGTLAPVSSQPTTPAVLTGSAHGGQQPLAGARVYLIGVSSDNTNGGGYTAYSMLGTTGPSTSQIIATPVFTNPAGSGTDATGRYVLTDSNGRFTFAGIGITATSGTLSSTYRCDADVVTYALVLGGNPGLTTGTNNTAVAEMDDLGPCIGDGPGVGDGTLGGSRFVSINEATTVAAAYALAGYMTGPSTLTYSGTALGATGLTNAGNNAAQLVDPNLGSVLATTPNGVGIVPLGAVSTLANILSACVNTSGPASPSCAKLFANATSDGTSTGTKPTDTLTAVLNIAHHPGGFGSGATGSVAQLYSLVNAVPAFGSSLTAAPNDWTLAIGFLGLQDQAQQFESPGVPAVDAAGNVWLPSTTPYAIQGTVYGLAKLSPLGALIRRVETGFSGSQAAVDPSGSVWESLRTGGRVVQAGNNNYDEHSFDGLSNDDGHQIALDGSGNVYISDYTNGSLYELNSSGTAVGSLIPNGNTSSGYHDIALLNNGEVLTVDNSTRIIGFVTPLGGYENNLCGSGASCSGGGLQTPTALAVDANAHIWALNTNSTLSAFDSSNVQNGNNNGNHLTGSPFSGGGLNTTTTSPNQPYPWLAIDGGGNVWVSNYTGVLSEFSPAGVALSPATGLYGSSTAACKGQGAAIDGSGNIWVGCDSSTVPVMEYIGLATPVATPLLPGNFGVRP